jgi:uncharacterized protein
MRLFAWLVLAFVLLFGAHAHADLLPPAPTHHVEDRAGVMSPAARDELDQRLAQYEREGGHQIIVWIADSIGERTIEDFAADAFAAWKVGRAKLDDGVALFVVTGARKLRIEVGYGVEDRLTDLMAAQIIRDAITPRLREGDFDGGITRGVEAIADVVEGRSNALPASTRAPPEEQPVDRTSVIVMSVVGVLFLILLFTRPQLALLLLGGAFRGGGGRGGGGGGFHGGGGRSGGGGATGSW